MEDLISIVIPTYNRSEFLNRAIDSCLNQTYKNIEILVVDDNDSNSLARKETERLVCNNYNNNKLRYIPRDSNGGGALARNTGIDKAKGKYIAFLDDDDEFKENYIMHQHEAIISNNVEVSISNYIFVDGLVTRLLKKSVSGYIKNRDAIKYFMLNGISYTSSFVFSKNVLQAVNGFTNSVSGQETILIAKILQQGVDIYFSEWTDVLIHKHQKGQISKSKRRIIGIKQSHEERKKLLKYISKPNRLKIQVGNQIVYMREYKRTGQLLNMVVSSVYAMLLYLVLITAYPKKALNYLRNFGNKNQY